MRPFLEQAKRVDTNKLFTIAATLQCQRNQANNLKMKNPETKYGVAPGLFAQIDEKLHGWLSSNRPFLGHVATSATSQFPLPENKPIDGQKNFNIPKEFVLIDLELNERAKERHSKGLTVEGKDAFSFVEMKVVKFAGFDPSMTQQRDALVQQWREKNKRVGRSDYHAPLAVALSMIAVRCQNIGRVSSWVTPLEDLPEVVIKQDLPGLLNTICEDGPDAIEPQAVFGQDC